MRAEIKARYGEEKGDTIICSMTHGTPVGNWLVDDRRLRGGVEPGER
ncbi:hypothetical protein [Actinomadura sp. 9N407]